MAAELEAAKSGAADGAWALATWAPAASRTRSGGFNFCDFLTPVVLSTRVFARSGDVEPCIS